MMMRKILLPVLLFALPFLAVAQCEFTVNESDIFDSTRLVVSEPIAIGLLIPSLYETVKGPRIIEEAKLLFSHAESDKDSLNSFFLTILAPEYKYHSIDSGKNVLIAFQDSSVVALQNFPDRGTFNDDTNMRMYQHTTVIPLDVFYRMTLNGIIKIRIRYEDKKRTISLSPKQQKALIRAVQCVGEAAGILPNKP